MKLFSFLNSLLTEGNVTIDGQLSAFEEEDLTDSIDLLQQFYSEDVLEMTLIAPAFSREAAIWAAKHVYLSLQLTVLRDVPTEIINETLKPFEGKITHEVIYSADLVLRHLPEILTLAKGLAPADIMVDKLQETAAEWAFSSVGVTLNQVIDDSIILSHPSLKISYIGRIIQVKDIKRITNNNINESVMEALGSYAPVFWSDFNELNITYKYAS